MSSLQAPSPKSQVPSPKSQVPSPKSQVPSPKSQAPSSKPQGPSPKSQARRYGWLVAAAVAVAMQALAGHPQVPVYTALALGLYALVRAVDRWRAEGDWRWLYRLPLTLAAIYLLGYGLAAIQLIPWVELGSRSPRAAGAAFEFVFGNSATGVDWLMLLFPYLFGSLQNNPYAGQPVNIATAIQIWEHAAYVGSLPLALAAYALLGLFPRSHVSRFSRWNARSTINSGADGNVPTFQRSNVPTLYFGLLLLGAVLFAAGSHTPLARLIYAAPVVGKLRDVERAMVLADFALAALAAIGMQRVLALGAQPRSWRPALLALAIVIALLPLGAVLLARQPSVQQALQLPPRAIANLQLSRLNAAVPVALGLLSAALLLWWSRRPATRLTQALAAGLVLLDVGGYAAAFNPTADPGLYQRRPDVLAALPADAAPYRKATFLPNNDLDNRAAQETLAVSWGMVYGVEDINGFNSLQPRRYTDYLVGPQVGDVSYGQLSDERLLRPESPILSSLNVRYLLVPAGLHPQLGEHFRQVYQSDEVRVYENVLAYPRAYFADSVRGEVDPAAVLRAVTADGFDGRRVALVESAEPPALPPPASDQDRVEIAQRSANRIALATSAATPRLLVLSEMDFPGWRAAVDGAATPIYTTNYLFRGVVVPPGAHTVTFEYRPVSALLGAGVSAAALLASLLLIVAGRSWRKLK
ncbi:MAG: YfhO family protein [Kouleothrix sp.]|nr:YfhO family protein [Kouleothrix sp.]